MVIYSIFAYSVFAFIVGVVTLIVYMALKGLY